MDDQKDKQLIFYKCSAFYAAYFTTIITLVCIVSYWAWNAMLDGNAEGMDEFMAFYFALATVFSFILWLVFSLIRKRSNTVKIILLGIFLGSLTPLILCGGFIAIRVMFFGYNPEIKLENVKLDRYINTVEEAVEIADQYSLAWDERVVTGAVSIHYKSKDDLINNKPDFWIHSGWSSNHFNDGSTITSISGDTLVEFSARQSEVSAPSIPLVKSESYLTYYDFMDFLDKLALEEGINWREFDDVYVRIRLFSNEHFSVDLRFEGDLRYWFVYKDGKITK